MTTQTHNPHIFPQNDTSWKNFFDITRYNKKTWLYKNEDGETLFGVIRHEQMDSETGKISKKIWQFCYDYNEDGELTYLKKNNWKVRPLYKVDELVLNQNDVLVVEGEKTCEKAQEILPEYFVTTWSGGARNWKKTNWETLKGKNVFLWPDADKGGVSACIDIARYLNEKLNVKAKVVNLPDSLPEKWDLADPMPEDLDYRGLIERAEIPDPIGLYEDIDQDLKDNRWVYIQDSLKLYWDRKRKQMLKAETLNLLYKRTRKKIGVAVSYLHENDIDIVDGTAYWPLEKEIINLDYKTYLNTFKPVVHEPLTNNELEDFSLNDIKHWRDHIKNVLCNREEKTFNYLEDTIAHDLQLPHENRTFAWVFSSKQGVGKSVFFRLITQLHGYNNVAWVTTDNLVDKYRSFMKHCHVIVCNEIDISGTGKSAKLDKLKELITEDIHPIEQKYVDTVNHRGHYRLYASSNKVIPLSVDPNDRRISFVNINTSREDLLRERENYFETLWTQLNDYNFVRKFYHYYKNVHKISKAFNKNEPIVTESKRELMNVSKPQHFKDLDDLFLDKSGPFMYDLVSTRDIIEHLRALDNQEGVKRPIYSRIDERQIHDWLNSLNAQPVWKKQPVSLIGDRKTNRRRYHAIRNKDKWRDCDNINFLRSHMKGQFNILSDIKEQEKQIEDSMNDLNHGRGIKSTNGQVSWVGKTSEPF